MTDRALSLVGPIITAYNAAEKAGADALRHALECGKHLCTAHETVTADKGKWKAWRDKNLPTVSEETERVYRRLAGAVAKKEDIFAKCKSIRDALKHLSGFDENLNPKPKPVRKPRQPQTGSSAAGLTPPEDDKPRGGSVDLTSLLANAGPDEVVKALRDADWQREDVEKLVTLLKTALAAAPPAAPPTPQPTPPLKRRLGLSLGAN